MGAAYFSSAGNNGRKAYESAFNNSGTNLSIDGENAGVMHDFDPGAGVDVLQSVTIESFGTALLDFQWDSPYASAGGVGANNDMDIFLLDSTGTQVLALSAVNNIGGDPTEILYYENDSFDTQFNIAITNFSGSDPELMKYIDFGEMTPNEYDTQSGTVFGHANAAGAEAVGAAFYQNTPAYGTNPAEIESYSSAGNTPIFFNTDGTRKITPEIRQKPEIVAPDGTNTTFFLFSDPESDGFPNFFGTSAAAPHAAAVAALLLDAQGNLSPNQIYDALETTARDMDDPASPGFDTGFDTGTGYGLIDANAAIASLNTNTPSDISINDVTVTEGNSGTTNADFTVQLSAASTQTVTVQYATANGTAIAPGDYTAQGLTSLTFNPGETSKTVSVAVVGDTVVEPNETFFVNLSAATNANITDAQGIGTITNDDVAAKPNITITDITLTEGNSGSKNANFNVKLSAASTQIVTVKYATANGTAIAPGDYTAKGLTSLTFNPGQTSKTVSVAVKGDTVVEPNETFFVNLSAATNANITDAQGKGTIKNDDVVAKPNITISDITLTEGNSGTKNANFNVKLSAASTQIVTVKYATANGTAIAPGDYTAKGLTSLTFNPGQTSKTVSVAVKGDTVVEPNETFFVNLSAATNANITDAQGKGTIKNDDVAVKPNITINNVTLTEGNSGTKNANFNVKLSTASTQIVTVKYATANGTAIAPGDYTAKGLTSLTFNPGQTSKTVSVAVKGDTVVEPNENFFVNLSAATNANITDAQGKGIITNDDVAKSKSQQIDSLTGTQAGDIFVLGNAAESFYDQQGSKDYAKINKFQAIEDSIQLYGSADDYGLKGTSQGTGIFLKNTGDLIGVVSNISDLSLDASYFSFV